VRGLCGGGKVHIDLALQCGSGRRERQGCARFRVVEERSTWACGRARCLGEFVLPSAILGPT
jgi:hypothetical protein